MLIVRQINICVFFYNRIAQIKENLVNHSCLFATRMLNYFVQDCPTLMEVKRMLKDARDYPLVTFQSSCFLHAVCNELMYSFHSIISSPSLHLRLNRERILKRRKSVFFISSEDFEFWETTDCWKQRILGRTRVAILGSNSSVWLTVLFCSNSWYEKVRHHYLTVTQEHHHKSFFFRWQT